MTGFFGYYVTLLICATVIYLAWRAESYFRTVDERQWDLAKRHQQLLEDQAHTARPAADLARGEIQLPNDLDALASQESEAWAIDETRQAMKEKFLELHTGDSADTWQRVRRAWGIGELP